MPHYKRNIRFVLYLILPILAFVLGWSFNQKYTEHLDENIEINPTIKSVDTIIDEVIKIPVKTKTTPQNIDLSQLWEVWNIAEENFLYKDRFKNQEQINGVIKGLIESLNDPYTIFMDAEETKKFDESVSGTFEGVGAELDMRDGNLVIISTLKGTPSEQAGLKNGDIITKINGENVLGMNIIEAVTKIRGPKGEKVALEIFRKSEIKPFEVSIVRDNISVDSFTWKIIDNIVIFKINQFNNTVMTKFNEDISEIILQNPKGIVVDLRNNSGGLFDIGLDLADEFLDEKVIVKTRGRKINNNDTFSTTSRGNLLEIPLVVIVNEGSASASEIFAGAIADNNRGILVGTNTFGKGAIQNMLPLSDGASLKITIAEWLTPNEKIIQEKGIMPDEEIVLDLENGEDNVLNRAVEILNTEGELERILTEKNTKNTDEEEGIENTEDKTEDEIIIEKNLEIMENNNLENEQK